MSTIVRVSSAPNFLLGNRLDNFRNRTDFRLPPVKNLCGHSRRRGKIRSANVASQQILVLYPVPALPNGERGSGQRLGSGADLVPLGIEFRSRFGKFLGFKPFAIS